MIPKIVKKPENIGNESFTNKKFSIFDRTEDYLDRFYDIRLNTVTYDFEIKNKTINKEFKILNINNIYIELNRNDIKISQPNLLSLLASDYIKQYNPFFEYFENLPKWDENLEKDYINDFSSYVKTSNNEWWQTQFKKWIVRMVKCALDDEYYNKQAIILVHNKQNSGKSTFCRFICPPTLNNFIKENISTDKDSLISICRNIIINLDELSTLSKHDISSIKTIISKKNINERLPYDRKNSVLPRRCSFIGSTNDTEFLTDTTGSVRWICIEVYNIDWLYSANINMDNVYSQAYSLLKSGFKYEMTIDEIEYNEMNNKKHSLLSVEYELIQKYFIPGSKEDENVFLTATDILTEIQQYTKLNLNKVNVGRTLSALNFKQESKFNGTYSIKGYYVKRL